METLCCPILASGVVLHNLLILMQEPDLERNLSEAEIRQMEDSDMGHDILDLPTADVEQNRNEIIQQLWNLK